MRLGWMKFRECRLQRTVAWGKIFVEDKTENFPELSVMLYGSETWCLGEKELAIRMTKRAKCGVKMMDRKNTNELMDMQELDETMDKMDKADGVRWYGHALRREDSDVLRKALEFKLDRQKKRERPKMTWRTQMEKEIGKVGLKQELAFNQTK